MPYAFQRLVGRADAEIAKILDQLADAGHPDLADDLRAEVLGRTVLEGAGRFTSSRSSTTGIAVPWPPPSIACAIGS